MNVSPNELRKETVATLKQVNAHILEVENEAKRRGRRPEEMTDENGGSLLAPLLLAKSQCLNTLTLLNTQR